MQKVSWVMWHFDVMAGMPFCVVCVWSLQVITQMPGGTSPMSTGTYGKKTTHTPYNRQKTEKNVFFARRRVECGRSSRLILRLRLTCRHLQVELQTMNHSRCDVLLLLSSSKRHNGMSWCTRFCAATDTAFSYVLTLTKFICRVVWTPTEKEILLTPFIKTVVIAR